MKSDKTHIDNASSNNQSRDLDELEDALNEAYHEDRFFEDLLDCDQTWVVGEDDESVYLAVGFEEYDALVDEGIITSEEKQFLTSHHHDIVQDKWQAQDIENRWNNALPLGDQHAMVLQKSDCGDGTDEPEVVIIGGVEIYEQYLTEEGTSTCCPDCGELLEVMDGPYEDYGAGHWWAEYECNPECGCNYEYGSATGYDVI